MQAKVPAHDSPEPTSATDALAQPGAASDMPGEEPLGFGVEGAGAPHVRSQLGLEHLHDLAQVVEVVVGPLMDDVARADRPSDVVPAGAHELIRGEGGDPGNVLRAQAGEVVEQIVERAGGVAPGFEARGRVNGGDGGLVLVENAAN